MNRKALAVAASMLTSACFAVISYDTTQTVTQPLELTGPETISVASDVTVTYSGEISGTGLLTKTGDGTLVLATANPDFSGGIAVQEGAVQMADFADPTKPNLLWCEETKGYPENPVFHAGRLLVPCGYQGLLVEKR